MRRPWGSPTPSAWSRSVYAPGCDRARIAALAPEVLAAAAEDPTVDDLLVRPAGAELAEAAAAAARSLGWTGGDLPLGLAGGFLLSSPVRRRRPFWTAFAGAATTPRRPASKTPPRAP